MEHFPCLSIMQIVNWRTHLKFPEEAKLSPEAKDLISKMLCNVDQRLGTKIKVLCDVSYPIYSFLKFELLINLLTCCTWLSLGSSVVQRHWMGQIVSYESCIYSRGQWWIGYSKFWEVWRGHSFFISLFIFLFLKCMKVQTYLRHFVANLVVSCDWLMML